MSDSQNQNAERNEIFQRSIKLLHSGEAAEAMALLEPLHERFPNDIEVALNLGGSYILQKRYEDAVAVLEPASRKEPGNHNVWVNLAAAHLGPLEESSEEQQARAISAYEQALVANPEVANVHYMLGLIYRGRKDNLRAAAHFTRALEQDPNDQDARRMLSAIAAESAKKN